MAPGRAPTLAANVASVEELVALSQGVLPMAPVGPDVAIVDLFDEQLPLPGLPGMFPPPPMTPEGLPIPVPTAPPGAIPMPVIPPEAMPLPLPQPVLPPEPECYPCEYDAADLFRAWLCSCPRQCP